jgi:cytidylate kinase
MAKSKDEKEKAKESLVVCICGMAGSGKSALANRLAEKYSLKYFSGGDALKALAIEEDHAAVNRGWWESAEGLRFLEKRGKERKFDEAVDKKLLKLARQGNIVLDSWTMPWLLNSGFKVWLDASLKKRAERVASRDGIGFKDALKALKSKERQTRAIYKKLYGFTLGEDFSPFHLILDTNNLNSDEVFEVLCAVMDNLLLGHGHNWFSQNGKN